MKTENSGDNIIKKSSHKRLIAAFVLIPALLIAALVFVWFTQEEPKPDPASEKIIRKAATYSLMLEEWPYREPNELTDEDFKKITEFSFQNPTLSKIYYSELYDIKLLEKFSNLKILSIAFIHYPEKAIPIWMKILEKLGIYDLKDRFVIDLSPIEKLTQLQRIDLVEVPINNLKPLSGLTKLQQLSLISIQVSNIEPIKSLTNLQEFRIRNCTKITDEQVEELQKALPNLKIIH